MTDRERAIVMAYTGIVMLSGDKLDIFYKYVSEKLGRPVLTHEFCSQAEIIKELSKDDFFSLCAGNSSDLSETFNMYDMNKLSYAVQKLCTALKNQTKICIEISLKSDMNCLKPKVNKN